MKGGDEVTKKKTTKSHKTKLCLKTTTRTKTLTIMHIILDKVVYNYNNKTEKELKVLTKGSTRLPTIKDEKKEEKNEVEVLKSSNRFMSLYTRVTLCVWCLK